MVIDRSEQEGPPRQCVTQVQQRPEFLFLRINIDKSKLEALPRQYVTHVQQRPELLFFKNKIKSVLWQVWAGRSATTVRDPSTTETELWFLRKEKSVHWQVWAGRSATTERDGPTKHVTVIRLDSMENVMSTRSLGTPRKCTLISSPRTSICVMRRGDTGTTLSSSPSRTRVRLKKPRFINPSPPWPGLRHDTLTVAG